MSANNKKWDWEIQSRTSWMGSRLDELWEYRHLLVGLVRRDFLLNYQQTVLGPFWIFFQPIMTLVTYVLVFDKLVGIPTGTVPPVLFYLAGIVLWNLFSDGFNGTSATYRENAHIFSKVYFPRLIMPLSQLSTHFMRFLFQMILLLLVIAYYLVFEDVSISVGPWLLALPFVILLTSMLALSLGLLFSVITAKYRDLANLVGLSIRLLMFLTPVIYSIDYIPEKVRWIVLLNPLTPLFELFRLSLLGEGTVTIPQLIYSVLFTLFLFAGSMLIFNKQGDKLIDVV
ncbi:ABC transporter permease [Pontibacter diazotrophicus]|uniref:Transport permease protein n=1 Tax=Pontibacter diazotrophicus TaxID=1400979 RepID=A0A3D8LH42_9BACT|nr:ABC transporter permease [Pontibacter diazotrophicus]RDV16715.1 ABC transporter permease [Pontibacter diazotrophicus]